METNTKIMSAREASRLAGVEIATIYRWVRIGLLPAYKIPSGSLRIREVDLRVFLEPQKPK